MRGVTEENLKKFKNSTQWCQRTLQDLLEECTELNPWHLIDTAPKDRELLLFVPDRYGKEFGKWDVDLRRWSCHPWIPTHWQELPENP